MKEKLIKVLLDSIDLEKLAVGLVEEVLEQAIKDAVAKTATPIDDAVVAMILPALNPALEALIKKEVDALKASLQPVHAPVA